MMCTLRKARDAILEARKTVMDAIDEHGDLFGLLDANDLHQDAASQISGEISKTIPERPIYERHP
jgi:hypothetical protein